jgi:hypothetical protein
MTMDPMTISLIAGAILGDKKARDNQANYKEQQKIEATKERFAPFTGQHGQTLSRPNGTDTMMQSLLTGAMIGQNIKSAGGAGAASDAGATAAAPVSGVGPAGTPMANANPYSGGMNTDPNQYMAANYTRPYGQ